MLGYTAHLRRDLARWRVKGWITAEQEERMAADSAAHSGFSAGSALAVLGAVLLCLAVLTFVAANWDALPRLVRLAVLFGSLWLAYAVAYGLFRTGHGQFGHAMLLVGGAVFGASIMLIAQTYHLSGDPGEAVLLWGAGVFLAAVLMASTASLIFANLLLDLWLIIGEMDGPTVAAWEFALAWGFCALLVWRQNSLLAFNALMLTLLMFILARVMQESMPPGAVALFGLAYYVLAGGWRQEGAAEGRADRLLPALAAYGALICLGDLMLLQTGEDFVTRRAVSIAIPGWAGLIAVALAIGGAWWNRNFPLAVLAGFSLFAGLARLALPPVIAPLADPVTFDIFCGVLILAGSLWLIADGGARGIRALSVIGYGFFVAELFYIYFKTFGGLLETSLFYLLAGLLLIAMSVIFVLMERRQLREATA